MMKEKTWGISGNVLKLIAVVCMVADHFAEVIIKPYAWKAGLTDLSLANVDEALAINAPLSITLVILKLFIGRLAFPIFCYLVAVGASKTRNVLHYALRLFALALVSEIPFDLCFQGKVLEFGYQNTVFTLALGVLAIWGFETIEREISHIEGRPSLWPFILAVLTAILAVLAAYLIHSDYGAEGVVLILALYFFKNGKMLTLIGGALVAIRCTSNPAVCLAFIPIGLYNGERGRLPKYFFYVFYPAHLLLIFVLKKILF